MTLEVRQKIFCIGFNKTGTSSLNTFFKYCGLKSKHNTQWPFYSKIKLGRLYFYLSKCYSDGEKCGFVRLKKWFPDSLFILNTRDERSWLQSRVKHILVSREIIAKEDLLAYPRYRNIARDFLSDEENAIRKWIAERRIYHAQARKYFAGCPCFLEIDVTSDPSWPHKIFEFFEQNGVNLKRCPSPPFPSFHRNERPTEEIADSDLLKQYYKLVDEILESLTHNQ